MPWLRLWTSYLRSPKVQRVTEVSRARHINLLCVACEENQNGRLPSVESMAWHLRLTSEAMQETLDELVSAGLVEKRAKSYWVHDWSHWQFSVTPAAERKRRSRDRHKASRDQSVTVTGQSRDRHGRSPRGRAPRASDSDSDSEKKNTLPANSSSELCGDAPRVRGDVAGTIHETEAERRARERAEMNRDVERLRNGKM